MKRRKLFLPLLAMSIALIFIYWYGDKSNQPQFNYEPPIAFNPPGYICYKTPGTIIIDGKLNSEEWDKIPWSADFVDIEGSKRPTPHFQTRVKMAYDSTGIYFAALMEEPHVWGTITQHDAVIFHDNDFEIFLNPSNDTHNYMEYEVNALGTVWDLFLTKPYRDGAVVLNNWEFAGMKSAVSIDGTVNNPSDTDSSWSIEVFIPWKSVYQPMHRAKMPQDGEHIRVNFSRVQWTTSIQHGTYVKIPIKGEEKIREYNWVWAPTGVIDIHRPEFWGFVQFSTAKAGEREDKFFIAPEEEVKWKLRNLYYRQATYRKETGKYAKTKTDLQAADICTENELKYLNIHTTPSTYEITLPLDNQLWHIRQDGLVWRN
ncbi:carbohydrate-binding family 9-like protein [Massilibacteroides sp.]|uniref:carbohydrate-binding family 9-like protein n=1 Tax=Massilibacteroides sp. TaxID=2034766 RepID=UPI0026086DFA|nr:carbohydrate-binding family 9-like protein [Massilibacteroides sp.]MDD4516695.1 carbohydrate-binding family 9-like protein [Massilibacteroides sp.]